MGTFDGVTSPARADTLLVGVDAVLGPGITDWPLEAAFEHALLVLEGAIEVEGRPVAVGELAYLGLGRQALALRTDRHARLLLLGGEPFAEPIVMWWNFVARSRAEVELASREWNARDPRFGSVTSPLGRIPAPPVPEGLRG